MENTAKLELILETVNSLDAVQKVLEFANKNYVFNQKDFRSLNSQTILQLISAKTLPKIEPSHIQESQAKEVMVNAFQRSWHPNEFKVFVWISVCHAYITNQEIGNFTIEDLSFLHSLFPIKTVTFIEFNLRCLLKQDRSTKQGWYQQELDLLDTIVRHENLKGKWTNISFLLFEKSKKKYFRSSHKCREQWYNHLDPSVLRSKWTLQEDYKLFQLISQIGTRWASISKSMDGVRTQHMVKNRYNALYKKYAIRYQRYATKKLFDIILNDLRKKMEFEVQDKEHLTNEQNLEMGQKSQNNTMETQEQKPFSEHNGFKIQSAGINLQEFLNTTSLLPQWESFEFQQIANFPSSDFLEPFHSTYYQQKIDLIDYCSLELEQYRYNFLQ